MATSGGDVETDDGTGGFHPSEQVTEVVRQSLITGTAIVLPIAVTVLLLEVVLNFVSTTLHPITKVIQESALLADSTQLYLVKALTVSTVIGIVFLLGFLAEYSPRSDKLGDAFDDLVGAIPGVGSVYTSFNEMSEILLDSDTDSFQDVKLVEYPTQNSYTVAFKTADTPAEFESATGTEDMITLFVPMAPNPVMGGFVVHVDVDRVVDVDMTVEQGIRSIVTSGVAVDEDGTGGGGLSPTEMRRLGRFGQGREETRTADDSADEGAAVQHPNGASADDRGDESGKASAVERSRPRDAGPYTGAPSTDPGDRTDDA